MIIRKYIVFEKYLCSKKNELFIHWHANIETETESFIKDIQSILKILYDAFLVICLAGDLMEKCTL